MSAHESPRAAAEVPDRLPRPDEGIGDAERARRLSAWLDRAEADLAAQDALSADALARGAA